MKTCSRCGETLPLDGFTANRSQRDGHSAYCRDCDKAYKREWSKKNRARDYESKRRWIEANREQRRAIEQSWRHRNPDKVRATEARYAESHPEQMRAKGRRRYARNPELWKAHAKKRKALVRGASTSEVVRIADVYERDGGICHLCGEPVSRDQASLDHLVPVSKGGAHAGWNVSLAHRRCNSSRGARDIRSRSQVAGLVR